MISDLYIYRAADMQVERHDSDALIEASRHIDRMLERGDMAGRLVWFRIKQAIEALQAPQQIAGAAAKAERPLGRLRGQFKVPDDFDAALPKDLIERFEK